MRTIADQTFVTERLVQLYPALKPVVTAHPAFLTEISSPSCFEALAQAIVHQQISMTVGRAIMQRLCQFCNDQVIPSRIIEASNEDLQQIGLSRQKRGYLLDLATRFELNPEWENELALQPDDDVIIVLTQVKGIGKWSVEMFLMFHLKRPDVWPVTDLGIRKAIMHLSSLPDLPTAEQSNKFGLPAIGMRSALAWYLWRYLSAIESGLI